MRPDVGQRSLKIPVLFCEYFDRVDAELDHVLSFDTTCIPVDARQGYALGVHLRPRLTTIVVMLCGLVSICHCMISSMRAHTQREMKP